jgi:hypothetical protein
MKGAIVDRRHVKSFIIESDSDVRLRKVMMAFELLDPRLLIYFRFVLERKVINFYRRKLAFGCEKG